MGGRARSSPRIRSTAEPPPAGAPAGLDRVWGLLAAAVDDRAAPLRTPVVATAALGVADGRVMVLRAVDRASATLTFFTDARAAKVAALAAAPDVAVVAYDPVARLQFRMRGTGRVAVDGAAVDAAWATVPPPARRPYRTLDAPGSVVASSDGVACRDDDGRVAFAVLTVVVGVIDVLDLTVPGHERIKYHRDGGEWRGEWRVP